MKAVSDIVSPLKTNVGVFASFTEAQLVELVSRARRFV